MEEDREINIVAARITATAAQQRQVHMDLYLVIDGALVYEPVRVVAGVPEPLLAHDFTGADLNTVWLDKDGVPLALNEDDIDGALLARFEQVTARAWDWLEPSQDANAAAATIAEALEQGVPTPWGVDLRDPDHDGDLVVEIRTAAATVNVDPTDADPVAWMLGEVVMQYTAMPRARWWALLARMLRVFRLVPVEDPFAVSDETDDDLNGNPRNGRDSGEE